MRKLTTADIQRAPSNLVSSSNDHKRTPNFSMLMLFTEVEKLTRELAEVRELVELRKADMQLIGLCHRNEIETAEREVAELQRQARVRRALAELERHPSELRR